MAPRPAHCFTPYFERLNKHVWLEQQASCKLLFSCFCFVFRYFDTFSRCSRPENNVKSPDCRFSRGRNSPTFAFFQFSTTIFNSWRCFIFMQDMKVKKAQDFLYETKQDLNHVQLSNLHSAKSHLKIRNG